MAQELAYTQNKNGIIMKKIIFALFAMIAFSTITTAQGFHVGAKAGANLGKIDGKSFKDEFNLGYQVGAFAELPISKTLGIQPELLFSQTNTTVTDQPLSGLTPGADIHLNYMNIPILLNIYASKLLTLQVGPQFSIITNNEKSTLQNAGNAFKSGDFAMAAGARINLGSFRVYGRYNIGLNNISDIDNSDQWKTQQVQFGLELKLF